MTYREQVGAQTQEQPERNGLADFLQAIAEASGRGYGYQGQTENGATPFGRYGMFMENWPSWSAAAGIGGHDMWDADAQDRVAGFFGQKFFQRYGSWDMVAGAWFAGQHSADLVMRRGKGVRGFTNDVTQNFVARYQKGQERLQQGFEVTKVPISALKFVNNTSGGGRGWIDPVAGQSSYSDSFLVPRSNKTGIHGAIDVYAKKGTPVVAPVGGTVLGAKTNDGKGGNWVQVRGTDGLVYYFAHMDGSPTVKKGQTVTAGAHLGFVGDSGNARGTSPHLHFSIKRGGTPINPYSYLQGSQNSGNTYTPDATGSQFTLGEQEPSSTSDKYNALLQSVSDQVAGGQRTDWRKLSEESVENTELLDQRTEQIGI